MPSLSSKLGADYLNQMYSGAWFAKGDHMYMFHRARNGALEVQQAALTGSAASPALKGNIIPDTMLESMDDFGWPSLGYRNVPMNEDIVAAYITSARSAQRGLRSELISIEPTPTARLLNSLGNLRDNIRTSATMKQVFRPVYHSFTEALDMLRGSARLDVALDRDVAIAINTTTKQYPFRVLFKQQPIGFVSERGELVVQANLVNRIRRLTGASTRARS